MNPIPLNMLLNKSTMYAACIVFICLMQLACSSTKQIKQKTILWGSGQNTTQVHSSNSNTGTAVQDYGFYDNSYSSLRPALTTPMLSNVKNSLIQIDRSTEENELALRAIDTSTKENKLALRTNLATKSLVADKIVENYLISENKEPGGHCLSVSKGRFEQAYKEVHGHLPYQDLPDSMASKFHTPKLVFNSLFVSASEIHPKWQNLPEEYRGKGNAGAIAYAGMGTLVDTPEIWAGQLRPGALMQVWRYKEDYEQVVQGTDVIKLDPYGHSFIFISYVRDEHHTIIGLNIADQGFQSYRPIVPRDYDVWWGVNLSI